MTYNVHLSRDALHGKDVHRESKVARLEAGRALLLTDVSEPTVPQQGLRTLEGTSVGWR